VSQPGDFKTDDAQLLAALNREIPEVRFDNVGFGDVVNFLRDLTGANIFVHWRAIEAAGIDRNAPVTLHLRGVTLATLLKTLMTDLGGGVVPLCYAIDAGVITITRQDLRPHSVETRAYDIRDLIVSLVDLNSIVHGGKKKLNVTSAQWVHAFIRWIEDTVAAETWCDNGGAIGLIREWAGQLIVTQTPENLRQIEQLIEQIRASIKLVSKPPTESKAKVKGPPAPTSTDEAGDERTGPKATHSADFTFVNWYGTEYTFALGVQTSAVKALWDEWEKTGLGLHQDTIRNAVDPERDSFRMDKAFRNHRAFGTMIQSTGDGKYKLVPAEPKKSLGIPSKARRKPR
jgi:hypothetical protein